MATRATDAEADGFTAEERAAMKERAAELRVQKGRRGTADKAAAAEADALEKIAEMPEPDRVIAERVHAIVREHAPALAPRTWYGQPAYAKDGQVVCFFQAASKFGTRYATLGFNESAALDDGAMWPTAFAITGLTDDVVDRVTDLVRRAAG